MATRLPRRVPQLQSYSTVLKIHSFTQEIDTDGCLVSIIKSVVHKPIKHEGQLRAAQMYTPCYETRLAYALISE